MKMQPADVFDRLSIVMLHIIHGNDDVMDEYNALIMEAKELSEITAVFASLLGTNAWIWRLESDIRKGKEGEMKLEEIGQRALAIRDTNKLRVKTKNRVTELLGGFKHVKTDHASA